MALSLKIDLEARFAQALDSFDKLEKQATRSMKRIDSAVGAVNTALGALGVGVSVGALAASFKAAVDELASLKDASEQTGSSVETISAALNTLRAAGGGGLESILELTDRFGRAIASAESDTSRAAEAFKKLGLNIDELKRLGRVEGVLELARAQAKFAEDGQKAVDIEAALGRGAARLIPDLNDLADTTLAAATATTQSATQADEANKAIARFQARLIAFRNDIAIKVLPVLTTFYNRARAFQEIGSNTTDFIDALFGDDKALQARAARTEETINRLREAQNKLIAERDKTLERGQNTGRPGLAGSVGRAGALPQGDPFGLAGDAAQGGLSIDERINRNNRQLQDLGLQLAQQRALLERRKSIEAEFGAEAPSRPSTGDASDSAGGKDPKPRIANSLRDIEDAAARIDKLVSDAITGSDVATAREYALALERLDFLYFNLGLSAEVYESAVKKLTKSSQTAGKDGVGEVNKELQAQARKWRDTIDPAQQFIRQLEEIRTLVKEGKLSPFEGIAAEFEVQSRWQDALEQLPEKLDTVKDSAQGLLAPIESAFETMILQGGKARDVLAGLANDIAQFIVRSQITGPLFEILGGKATSKSVGGTLIGSLFGFAGGGDPPVGRWSVVGEKGPELIRPLSPMRVYPNGYGPAGGGGVNITQQITVGSGVNRTEVAQAMYAAKEAAKAEILASMRRGSTFAAA